MNEENYTSLELSKWLKWNGCELENEYAWDNYYRNYYELHPRINSGKNIPADFKEYPAYDILNDLCVKYAKRMFKNKCVCRECMDLNRTFDYDQVSNSIGSCNNCGSNGFKNFLQLYEYLSLRIMEFLQQNKKQEAEDYIKEHCIFNPKNQ